ncbi:MAG: hypothetical protein JWN25_2712 [Verrucomicrobiales bacterium]|jgi:hypothetical protein|nr:hypothetical protein [Verrucomicrobiales bacterium]MDB6129031.1 hypothetical protein [Verrucomicrobiales bacterium]
MMTCGASGSGRTQTYPFRPHMNEIYENWQNVEKHPELHKSCENCTSVMPDIQPECPVCLGYRFTKDIDVVLERVRFHYKRGAFISPKDPTWLCSNRYQTP